MAAKTRAASAPEPAAPIALLGPAGPFPDAALTADLERRWLHYAFLSRDDELAMVHNSSWLGPDPRTPGAGPRWMSILLVHRRGLGWGASQFNAETLAPPWSAFRQPHGFGQPGPYRVQASSGFPYVNLTLSRTSRPCTSQCAPFAGDHTFRWQSEPGVLARGDWGLAGREWRDVPAIGYHERVRGRWGWPQMGGWVFGFVNDPAGPEDGPPPTAVVFTLIQPADPPDGATGSLMLWHEGRLRRHFPRRCLSAAVRGALDRDRVCQTPELANLFSTPPMAQVPRRLVIAAAMGPDRVTLDFECLEAARIVIPSESGIAPFSVHEVVGPCRVEGRCAGRSFAFETRGIVEFAGGAQEDPPLGRPGDAGRALLEWRQAA
jgi:hypothetical protein